MSNFVAKLLCEEIQASFNSFDKDIEVICSQNARYYIHRSVLCALSPMIRSTLNEGIENEITLLLPDHESIFFEHFCRLMYFGEINQEQLFQSEHLHAELMEICRLLGIEIDLTLVTLPNLPSECFLNFYN